MRLRWREVAQLAGVSEATVSRVMNGRPGGRERTRPIAVVGGPVRRVVVQRRLAGIREALVAAGLDIDEQLVLNTLFSVEGGRAVGFDDSALMAASDPPLTTVRQPIGAMGEPAVRRLLELIDGAAAVNRELLFQPELVVRRSTGLAARPVGRT